MAVRQRKGIHATLETLGVRGGESGIPALFNIHLTLTH
jgi:hypothetical protein